MTPSKKDYIAQMITGEPMAVEVKAWHEFTAKLDPSQPLPPAPAVRLFKLSNGNLQDLGELATGPHSNNAPQGAIALLSLSGIMLSRDVGQYHGIQYLTRALLEVDANPNITGIILEVNSGGGEVTAGQMLQSTLSSITTPIVAWVHQMASGAVMGTLPIKNIVLSSPGAVVGSIGTMIELSKWYGNYYRSSVDVLYAKESTNKNRSFREYLTGNTKPYQNQIDEINKRFLGDVKKYRNLKGEINHTLSGEMFSAQDAISRGLAHRIGNFTEAVRQLTKTEQATASQSQPHIHQAKVIPFYPVSQSSPLAHDLERLALVSQINEHFGGSPLTARQTLAIIKPAVQPTPPAAPAAPEVRSWEKDPINVKAKSMSTPTAKPESEESNAGIERLSFKPSVREAQLQKAGIERLSFKPSVREAQLQKAGIERLSFKPDKRNKQLQKAGIERPTFQQHSRTAQLNKKSSDTGPKITIVKKDESVVQAWKNKITAALKTLKIH